MFLTFDCVRSNLSPFGRLHPRFHITVVDGVVRPTTGDGSVVGQSESRSLVTLDYEVGHPDGSKSYQVDDGRVDCRGAREGEAEAEAEATAARH